MAVEVQRQTAGSRLYQSFCQVPEVLHIVFKMLHMYHIGVIVRSERSAVPAVIDTPDAVARLQHIVNRFGELLYGFRKTVAEHNNAFFLIRPEVFIIYRLAFDTLHRTRCSTLRYIRLGLFFHVKGIVCFFDPLHGIRSACLSRTPFRITDFLICFLSVSLQLPRVPGRFLPNFSVL